MYLTSDEYNLITGRPVTEATEQRIQFACELFNKRINLNQELEELDLTELTEMQRQNVKRWIAYMVSYLYDNKDIATGVVRSISLGKFSATYENYSLLPRELHLADTLIRELIDNCVQMK